MALSEGTRLGPYEIVAAIGAGGMGEVYRARDTKLNRDVAIKVLPDLFAQDAERLARFTREAQTLAALNHPNIAHIHGLEESGGVRALVMELVEGDDLSVLIARGPMPPADALPIAKQIAEALEAAHELGIVHRDLKPANIKVRADGTVKVLDFGLAKAMGANDGSQGASDKSPTMTTPAMTRAGMIMGTAAYMSPEQARGRVVDRRADIWAFGVVLGEMFAGRPLFLRDTVTDTLSAILRDEPDWTALRNLPPHVDQLLHRCLEKDARLRLRDIGEARILLSNTGSGPMPAAATAPTPARASITGMIIAGLVMAGIAGGATWFAMRRGPAPVTFPPSLVKITTDAGYTLEPTVAPNGSLIAYASDRGGEGLDIWVQPLPGGEPVQITRDAADDREPDFSPDGSRIVFRSERNGGGIYEVPALGGTERLIAAKGRTPKFSPDGKWISYSVGGRAVRTTGWMTDGRGGTARELAPSIEFIPSLWCRDGTSVIGGGWKTGGTAADWYAVSADGGAATSLGLAAAAKSAGLDPNSPAAWLGDEIVFTHGTGDNSGSLWAVPMDGCRRVAGAPHRLTMSTSQDLSPSVITIAGTMRLFYASVDRRSNIYRMPLPAAADAPLVTPLTDDAALNMWPSLSSDGRALAFVGARAGTAHLIVRDLAAKTTTDVAVTSQDETSISPDGRSLATLAKGGISLQPVAGGDARLISVAGMTQIWDWPRPALITGSSRNDGGATAIAVDVETGRSTTILESPASKFLGHARLSPDGKWMSMMDWSSADRGRVIIVPFDGVTTATASQIIPITDGQAAVEENAWSIDGNTIYVVSEADGYRCVWSRRLDPRTRQPIGPLTPVAHFHRARQQIVGTASAPQRLDMSPAGLVFAMAERHGNIWMATVKK